MRGHRPANEREHGKKRRGSSVRIEEARGCGRAQKGNQRVSLPRSAPRDGRLAQRTRFTHRAHPSRIACLRYMSRILEKSQEDGRSDALEKGGGSDEIRRPSQLHSVALLCFTCPPRSQRHTDSVHSSLLFLKDDLVRRPRAPGFQRGPSLDMLTRD